MCSIKGALKVTFKLGGKLGKDGDSSRYIGGFVKVAPIPYDQWGMMMIKSYVEEYGYKNWEDIYIYVQIGTTLKELLTDSDTWELFHVDELPSELELWVVTQSDSRFSRGNDTTNFTDDEYTEDATGSDEEDDADLEDVDYDEDDLLFDMNVDRTVEFHGIEDNMPDFSQAIEVNALLEQQVLGSDDESLSEGEVVDKLNLPVFNPKRDMKNPHFSVGLVFPNKELFKEAVANYAFNNGKRLRYEKNDNKRVYVGCVNDDEISGEEAMADSEKRQARNKPQCPWKLRCHRVSNSSDLRVTYFNDIHEGCSWKYYNKMMNSSLIAKRWKKEMKYHPNWRVKDFQNRVKTQERCHVTYKQAWKAMKKAHVEENGRAEEDYRDLWKYCQELLRSNPGSSCRVKCQEDGGVQRFQRIYICWEACREGFKACRQIIGLDGCHLIGKYGGVLLVANGVDGNENIFPFAYAVVESENKESWTWFLELLRMDLNLTEAKEASFTFMTDKQKGLLPSFDDVLPRAQHRFCVRHLEGNFKLAGFSGKEMKDLLWEVAKATTNARFLEAMKKIKEADVNAYLWLQNNKHASEWSRSHFHIIPRCDILTNNICESYNRVLKEARSLSLIPCLEKIREMVMQRLFALREKAETWKGVLCPTISTKLAVNSKLAGGYNAIQSATYLFEVRGYTEDREEKFEGHVVDLFERTCTCNSWQLTGIPCKHGVCAIWLQKDRSKRNVDEFVDEYYSLDTYKKVYSGCIKPLRGRSEWDDDAREPSFPPIIAPKVGRPKKTRKKSVPELTKDGKTLNTKLVKRRCTMCKVVGHNKKTCPEDPQAKARQAQAKERKKKNQEFLRRRKALQSKIGVHETSLNASQAPPTVAVVQEALGTNSEMSLGTRDAN